MVSTIVYRCEMILANHGLIWKVLNWWYFVIQSAQRKCCACGRKTWFVFHKQQYNLIAFFSCVGVTEAGTINPYSAGLSQWPWSRFIMSVNETWRICLKLTSAKSQQISNRLSWGLLYERNIELSYNCFVPRYKIGTDMIHFESMMTGSSCRTRSVGVKGL